MRHLIFCSVLILFFTSCRNNLERSVTLKIDDSNFLFTMSVPPDAKYYFLSDSAVKRNEVVNGIKDLYRKKGNDVSLVDQNPQFVFKLISCSFRETETQRSMLDPQDSTFPYDSLHFILHSIEVDLTSSISNSQGYIIPITESSSDAEEIRTGSNSWQTIFGHKDYYPHSVKHIGFPEKQFNRVLRRAHQEAMAQMKTWLGN